MRFTKKLRLATLTCAVALGMTGDGVAWPMESAMESGARARMQQLLVPIRARGNTTEPLGPPAPGRGLIEPVLGAPAHKKGKRAHAGHKTAAPEPAPEPYKAPRHLGLTEAILMAWSANPDFKSAAARADLAEEMIARARADLFPTIALNVDYAESDNALRKFTYLLSEGKLNPQVLFRPPQTVDNFHTYIHLAYEVYTGGLRLAQNRAADAEHDSTHHALDGARNRIVFHVAEAYFRLYQAQQLVGVRRELVALTERQLADMRVRLKNETVTRTMVMKVDLKLAEMREQLISARTKEKLARAVLENVTGAKLTYHTMPETLEEAPWAAHVEKVEAVADQYASLRDAKDEVRAAVQQRPEVAEGADAMRAAEQRVLMAQAANSPKVGVSADYDFYAGDFQQVKGTYFVAMAVSLPIFDAGRTKATVRQAMAQVDEIAQRNRRVQMDVELDIRKSLLALSEAKEKLEVAELAVKTAIASLAEVRSEHKNETATDADLLEAQTAVSDAKIRAITARTEVEIARAAVERSTGFLAGVLQHELSKK
jgi:outer membrane protein